MRTKGAKPGDGSISVQLRARVRGLTVGVVVGTNRDRKRGAGVRVELEDEAVRLVETHGVEVVTGREFLVAPTGGEGCRR